MKKKKIRSSVSEYFNFSSRERRGAFFLACILVIQIFTLYFLRNSAEPFPVPDKKIIALLLEKKSSSDTNRTFSTSILPVVATAEKKELFAFDPNSTSEESWKKLGLSQKQINVIQNFISHKGQFRIKKDFKKMYCITSEEYNRLNPFINLPDSFVHEKKVFKKEITENKIVDIQHADSSEFLVLKGIGLGYAARIVKYREKLGGFYSIDQLKEVWGFNDTIFEKIKPFIILNDSIPFRLIHLNTDSFSVFISHPYLHGKIAGILCNYRKQHKGFSTIDELRHLPLITEENFRKLAHYVTIDHP